MRPAGAVEVLRLRIDAEVAVHRRQHVLRRLGVGLREGALGVGRADDPAALDRAAGQGGAEDVGVVVAAGVVVDRGVRPNSPQAITSVDVEQAARSRSSISAEYARSKRGRKPSRSDSKPLTCVSHQRRSTVTSRTPASTSRRASRMRWLQAGQPQRLAALGSNAGMKP